MGGRRTRSTRMTQIWALYRQSGSDRLKKQPTDLAAARQYTSYFGDRILGFGTSNFQFPGLQVDYHVVLRLGATDQQIALGWRLERFGLVVDTARD